MQAGEPGTLVVTALFSERHRVDLERGDKCAIQFRSEQWSEDSLCGSNDLLEGPIQGDVPKADGGTSADGGATSTTTFPMARPSAT